MTGGVVAALAVGVFFLVAFVTGTWPLAHSDDVSVDEVCGSLADHEASARAFNTLLPESEAYEIHGSDPERTDAGSDSFDAGCIARTDGDAQVAVRTQLITTKSPGHWFEGQLEEGADAVRFPAGYKAAASAQRAVILVPCVPEGVIQASEWSLSVEAWLDMEIDAPADETAARQALADLAYNAARRAHDRANCELPSQLPEAAPALGGRT